MTKINNLLDITVTDQANTHIDGRHDTKSYLYSTTVSGILWCAIFGSRKMHFWLFWPKQPKHCQIVLLWLLSVQFSIKVWMLGFCLRHHFTTTKLLATHPNTARQWKSTCSSSGSSSIRNSSSISTEQWRSTWAWQWTRVLIFRT